MRSFDNPRNKNTNRMDYLLMALSVLLGIFGLLMVFESSNVSAFRDFNDKYYFVKEQIVNMGLGVIMMFALSLVNYRKLFNISVPLIIASIFGLLAVFIPGLGVKALGAHRWINLGFMNFQPSELTKISVIIYLSSWLSNKEKGRFFSFLLLMFLVLGLIIIQPDLGTAVILCAIFIVVYWLSGAPAWQFSLSIPVIFLSVLVLALASPYRYQRLITFLNPNVDPLGSSYHIRQVLISLGSGGMWGMGLGGSKAKYQFLPEATTDSIFAIIGEEFGFAGSAALIGLIFYFLYRIYKIMVRAPDKLGFLLCGGLLALFTFQFVINLGAMVALFPMTGTPLPFISYGGSNLIISYAAIGILLNISKYRTNKN